MRLDAVEMEIPGALSSVVPLEAVFEQERDGRYRQGEEPMRARPAAPGDHWTWGGQVGVR
jgi:hypothetical protein